jgi:hypothetical protein
MWIVGDDSDGCEYDMCSGASDNVDIENYAHCQLVRH